MDLLNRVRQISQIKQIKQGDAPVDNAAAATVVPLAAPDPEAEWRQRIYQHVVKLLDLPKISSLDEDEARRQIREICQRVMHEELAVPLAAVVRQNLVKQIEAEILGLGPLEPLLADRKISDILVNGCSMVFIERGGRLERTSIRFYDDAHLLNIIDRIVSRVGRRIDESSPMVDARLKDGSRVNAIIPPLAIDGPSLSIRRFAVERLSAEQLVEYGSITPAMAEILRSIVRGRFNVLISGGTGSGKTTLLNVLSSFIPHHERIITIEDSAELQLQQPHVVRLETRPPNLEGRGEITQRDLVRNSLRMRPDRIVLGEVRGAEAVDMLQAMNTGHDGSLTTIHANSPRDALTRIESMVALSAVNLPTKPLRSQIASAIEIVVQTERQEDGRRRVVSLQEINGMEGDIITMSEIFSFRRRGVDEQGNVVGDYRATGIVPKFYEQLQQRGIPLDIRVFSPNWEA